MVNSLLLLQKYSLLLIVNRFGTMCKLVMVMAGGLAGNTPFSWPVRTQFIDELCVSRGQWVDVDLKNVTLINQSFECNVLTHGYPRLRV